MKRALLIATVWPAALWAAGDGVEAMCRGADDATIRLDSHEFDVTGYDPGRGVVAVRLAPFVVRANGRTLGLRPIGPVLLAMGATDLDTAVDARRKDTLRLDVRVRCTARPTLGPYADACCDEATPVLASLRTGQLLLAERDVTKPFPPRPRMDAHVAVGRLRVALGDLPAEADEVTARARMHGHACLKRALHGARSVQGSLSVVLQMAESAGPPIMPTIGVDALANQEIRNCLVHALHDDAALWQMVPSGSRLLLPFYFRGGSEPSSGSEAEASARQPSP